MLVGCGPLLGSVPGQADGRLHARSREQARTPPPDHWNQIQTDQTKAKYLGIIIGTDATPEDTLNPLLLKYERRLAFWMQHKTHLPPSYKLFVCNTYLFPLFSYYT